MTAEAVPGLGQFCADLARLHVECGRPKLRVVADRIGRAVSTISDILNGKYRTKVPDWEFVAAFVTTCAEHAEKHDHRPVLSTDPEDWRRRHRELDTAALVRARPITPNPWRAEADSHAVWWRVPDADQLRPRVVEIAGHLFERWHAAVPAGDRWLEDDFAERMTGHVTELLETTLRDSDLDCTAGEAALLVLAPYVHQTRTAVLAERLVEVRPTDLGRRPDPDPLRRSYQQFLDGPEQGRLVARAAQAAAPEDADIAWWLFHRWAETRAADVTASGVLDELPVDDPPLRRMLGDSLDRLVRLFRLEPEALRDDQRRRLKPRISYPRVTTAQQHVREDRIGLLLAVAHAQSVELLRLSSTLVEHIGIPKPVYLTQLRVTLSDAHWDHSPVTRRLALVASCRHEAVLEALREHVVRTDLLLGAVRAAAEYGPHLEPLRDLPARASADQVEPAEEDGRPVFVVPVTKLRLDESRVRELLMGVQLYGDRSLAIRELYQNALDACRYAKARLEYLERTSNLLSRWEGEILFRQGVEAGRPYLSCTDNGIGMGESQLREVFSQAGTRFADQPEFLEEKARWAEEGVPFHPNSKFGIGVMSYFMLADEIEVVTSRMNDRGESTGSTLRVSIAGPGHLFRIEPDERVMQGTTVKLYLRDGVPAPSCVEVLQRLLGIAEFRTTARQDGVPPVEWEPAAFSSRSVRGGAEGIFAGGALVPSRHAEGQVVWCQVGGAVLVDGIHVQLPRSAVGVDGGHGLRGAVVNLTGHRAPSLTVDRTSVLGDVSGHVRALLDSAADDLLDARHPAFDFDWLCEVAAESPEVADVVALAAARRGDRLHSLSGPVDAAVTGCFPLDPFLTRRASLSNHGQIRSGRLDRRVQAANITLWRLVVSAPGLLAGRLPDCGRPPLALPSDQFLITPLGAGSDQVVPPGHVVSKAVASNRDPRSVAARLAVLGFDVGDVTRFPDRDEFDHVDVTLLSRGRVDGPVPWYDAGATVPLGHLIAVQITTGRVFEEVVDRMRRYSLDPARSAGDVGVLSHFDQVLVSRNLNGRAPWLEQADRVGLGHVYYAAHLFNREVEAVAERLTVLGFTTRPGNLRPDWLDRVGPAVEGLLLAESGLPDTATVPMSQLVNAAQLWLVPPAEAVRRFADLGRPATQPADFDPGDRVLLPPAVVQGALDEPLVVDVRYLLTVADRVGQEPREVAARLVELGYEVPPCAFDDQPFDGFDRQLQEPDYSSSGGLLARNDYNAYQVVDFAHDYDLAPSYVAKRLTRLGYSVPALSHLAEPLTQIEYRLFDVWDDDLAAAPPGGEVPFAHVLQVARSGGWPIAEVVAAVSGIGHSVRGAGVPDEEVDQTSLDVLEEIKPVEPVTLASLLSISLWLEVPVTEVHARLARWGLEVPDLDVELPELAKRLSFDAVD
ncbi:hypothetical protein AB0I60_32460 [Actinosynnema sp. NPDC050436]|uniref:wHTH domain-containing protein n=1 Tax=Actinosynnema sp. NPDC050436 TaxID=3155659 RepID=UPI0033F4BEFD